MSQINIFYVYNCQIQFEETENEYIVDYIWTVEENLELIQPGNWIIKMETFDYNEDFIENA